MKKIANIKTIFLLIIVLSLIFIAIGKITSVKAKTHNIEKSVYEINPKINQKRRGTGASVLGKAIRYLDRTSTYEVAPINILKPEFYNKLQKNIQTTYENRGIYEIKGINSVSNMDIIIRNSLHHGTYVNATLTDIEIGMGLTIMHNFSEAYTKKISSHFESINVRNYRYFSSISNANYFEQIKNNLSHPFLDNLNTLLGKNSSDEEFFSFFRYNGTHLLTGAHYGGSLKVLNAFFSNEVNLKYSIASEISNSMNVNLMDLKGQKYSTSKIKAIMDKHNKDIEYYLSYEKRGGSYNFGLGYDAILRNFNKWLNSIEGNEDIISIPLNGTIPFWELLPDHLKSKKQKLKEKYNLYITNSYRFPKSMDDIMQNKNDTFSLYNIDKNIANRIITDAGYNNNIYDTVFLSDLGISLDYLKVNGYKTITVNLNHKVKEIYDGYQYVALYNDYGESIQNIWKEHGRYKLFNFYGDFSLDFDSFSIEKLKQSFVLQVRYDASGYGRDDWTNKDVNLQIRFKK